MALSPVEQWRIASLEAKIAALERLTRPTSGIGQGSSTLFGSLNIRSTQLGFAAELTSTFNTTTGYNWKRLALDTTGSITLTNPAIQLTGNRAYSIDGSTTLASGTKGWLEPSPESSGYLFTTASSASAGFFARLTTSSSGNWNFYKLKLSSGAYTDDGSEVTGYNAVPLTIDGTNLCNPVAGLRVWMIPSQQSGKYEFLPLGYASDDTPGLVSLSNQTMGDGQKAFSESVSSGYTIEGGATWDGAVESYHTGIGGFIAFREFTDKDSATATAKATLQAGGGSDSKLGYNEYGAYLIPSNSTGSVAGLCSVVHRYFSGSGVKVTKLAIDDTGSNSLFAIGSNDGIWTYGDITWRDPQGWLNTVEACGGIITQWDRSAVDAGITTTVSIPAADGLTYILEYEDGILIATSTETTCGGELTGFAKGTELIRFRNPKPLNLTPTKPLAVVTAATGRKGRELLEVSGPLMRAYADRIGADFVTLTKRHPSYALSVKWGIRRVLEHYERIIFLDADILVPADAPDLFDLCRPSDIGASDELPWLTMANPKVLDEYQWVRTGQGKHRVPCSQYFNSGVIVASRYHADLFGPPPGPAPVHHCLEQHWWNARLYDTATPVTVLPREANWQWWTDREFKVAPSNAMLHFSGIQSHTSRMRYMKQFAAKLSS